MLSARRGARARKSTQRREQQGLDCMQHLLLKAVVLPVILVGFLAITLGWQMLRLWNTMEWVEHSEQVIGRANELQKLLLDKETGLRGFLVTGESIFLQPFEEARPLDALDELAHAVSDNPAQTMKLGQIRALVQRWDQQANASIQSPAQTRNLGEMLERKSTMDELRALIAAFLAEETALRDARALKSRHGAWLTLAGSTAVLLCLAGAIGVLSRRQIRLIRVLMEKENDARRKAEEASRAKDDFLCMLSHELRTPLTPILGWATLLRSKQITGDAFDRAVTSIERNTRAEIQIVEDILDVSRIIAGKLQVKPRVIDLAHIVRCAADSVRPSADARGVILDVAIDPPSLATVGDAARLQQVIWNLLNNAIKFTSPGGRVQVQVAVVNGAAQIWIKDNGEGIPRELLPHIFERFWQADTSTTRARSGLGLGLSIAKHLTEAHGGKLLAESEGRGKGATFSLTLPLPVVIPDDDGAEAPELAKAGDRWMQLLGVHVLVVDDDEGSREIVAEILRRQGAEVHLAPSGPHALDLLRRTQVDVVVSDIAMPGMDGYELIKQICESRGASQPDLARLALSAHAQADDVDRARRAGFQAHLAKPVAPERLVTAVATLIRQVAAS